MATPLNRDDLLAASEPCPCHGGRSYGACCRPWHHGAPAPTPEALMRSRFAAYALGLVDHIVATTDPKGPQWQRHAASWRRSIAAFCEQTHFLGLQVLDSGADGDEGHVTFLAMLTQGGHDASFTERSRFTRAQGRWRYHSGTPVGTPHRG